MCTRVHPQTRVFKAIIGIALFLLQDLERKFKDTTNVDNPKIIIAPGYLCICTRLHCAKHNAVAMPPNTL